MRGNYRFSSLVMYMVPVSARLAVGQRLIVSYDEYQMYSLWTSGITRLRTDGVPSFTRCSRTNSTVA